MDDFENRYKLNLKGMKPIKFLIEYNLFSDINGILLFYPPKYTD